MDFSAADWVAPRVLPEKSVQVQTENGAQAKLILDWTQNSLSLKFFVLAVPWNLAKFVKISPGIIAHLHQTNQKQMRLLSEQCAE